MGSNGFGMDQASFGLRRAALLRAWRRDGFVVAGVVVLLSAGALVARIWLGRGAAWPTLISIGVLLGGTIWYAAVRRRRLIRAAGLACGACDDFLISPDGVLLTRDGVCPRCGYRSISQSRAVHSIPVAPAALLISEAEFRARLERYQIRTGLHGLLLGAVCLGSFVVAGFARRTWSGTVPWVSGAGVVFVLTVNAAAIAILYRRWKGIEGEFKLVCTACGRSLVGGEDGEVTRATLAAGICPHCGVRIFE